MADLKISQLSAATALAGTEVVPVVQGGATKKATIDQILAPASGKGIDFSAAGGDTLKMYDEGTWTPRPEGAGGTITSYTSAGTYTRVGRQVTCTFIVTITNVGTATTMPYIRDLPFTANASTALAVGTMRETANTGLMWACNALAGDTTLRTVRYDNSAAVATNNVYIGTITYIV